MRDYIAHLRRRSSPHTVLGRLRNLSSAVAVMDCSADRALIKLALSRLSRLARPVRNKLAALQSPSALLDLGLSLMTNWQDRTAHDPRLNAMDYRDGLMIAFLALCPIRLGNLAAMVIGQHLSFVSGAPRVVFAAGEMKGKRALDVDFPAELRQALNLYLERIHPMLHARDAGGQSTLAQPAPDPDDRARHLHAHRADHGGALRAAPSPRTCFATPPPRPLRR